MFDTLEESIWRNQSFFFICICYFWNSKFSKEQKRDETDSHWHPKPRTALLMCSWKGVSSKSGFELIRSAQHALEHSDQSKNQWYTNTWPLNSFQSFRFNNIHSVFQQWKYACRFQLMKKDSTGGGEGSSEGGRRERERGKRSRGGCCVWTWHCKTWRPFMTFSAKENIPQQDLGSRRKPVFLPLFICLSLRRSFFWSEDTKT